MYLKKIKFNNKFSNFLPVVAACVSWPFSASKGNKVLLLLLLTSPYSELMPRGSQILKKWKSGYYLYAIGLISVYFKA